MTCRGEHDGITTVVKRVQERCVRTCRSVRCLKRDGVTHKTRAITRTLECECWNRRLTRVPELARWGSVTTNSRAEHSDKKCNEQAGRETTCFLGINIKLDSLMPRGAQHATRKRLFDELDIASPVHPSRCTSRTTGWHGKDFPRLSGALTTPSSAVQVTALENRTRLDLRIRVHLHVDMNPLLSQTLR